MTPQDKLKALQDELLSFDSVAVAFSGGVDSTFLLAVAGDVLGKNCLALTAKSPLVPPREVDEARRFCADRGIAHEVIDLPQLDDPGVRGNPPDRCYHCKYATFSALFRAAACHGITTLAEGSNMDDTGDYRPGLRAVAELGVKSPLRDAGLYKAEIRELSREMGLPTWRKPALACLASRIPYGQTITAEKLAAVDHAEDTLRRLGLTQVRVRLDSGVARIEALPDEFPLVMENRPAIVEDFKALGFAYVTLDLQGYRTGSMNEALRAPR